MGWPTRQQRRLQVSRWCSEEELSLCPPARSPPAAPSPSVWPAQVLSALKFFSRRNQHSRKQSSPSPSHLPSAQLQSPIAIDSFFDREDPTYLCNHVPQRPQTVDAGGQRPLCLWQSCLGRWPVPPPLLASFSLVPISCHLVHRSAPALRLGAPARIARSWFSISSTASIDFWLGFLGRVDAVTVLDKTSQLGLPANVTIFPWTGPKCRTRHLCPHLRRGQGHSHRGFLHS